MGTIRGKLSRDEYECFNKIKNTGFAEGSALFRWYDLGLICNCSLSVHEPRARLRCRPAQLGVRYICNKRMAFSGLYELLDKLCVFARRGGHPSSISVGVDAVGDAVLLLGTLSLSNPCLTTPAGEKVGRIIPEVMADNTSWRSASGPSGGLTYGNTSERGLNERPRNSNPRQWLG
jgi:hypothetical protein